MKSQGVGGTWSMRVRSRGEALPIWFILLITAWKVVLKSESWKSRLQEEVEDSLAASVRSNLNFCGLTTCRSTAVPGTRLTPHTGFPNSRAILILSSWVSSIHVFRFLLTFLSNLVLYLHPSLSQHQWVSVSRCLTTQPLTFWRKLWG